MNIECKNGYIIITDIISGFLVTRKYLYYAKNEAIREFKKEFNL